MSGGFLWALGVEWVDRFLVVTSNNSFYPILESFVYRYELKFGVDGSEFCVFEEFTFTSLVGVESSDFFYF